MPLELPSLDDRTYEDLRREGIELIPRFAPGWTNHNASDPGITLLELFAYITEIYLYRVDRISDLNRAKFLKLLNGADEVIEVDETTSARLQGAAGELRRPSRAVSQEDFELLALDALAGRKDLTGAVVRCLPRRDLEARTEADRRRDRPNHVSVVFIPADLDMSDREMDAIADRIRTHLDARRLLTSRLHVVRPRFVELTIHVEVAPSPGQELQDVEARIRTAIGHFFHPVSGGAEGRGWPLGQSLYLSDLYRLLSPVEGVARLNDVEIVVDSTGKLLTSESGDVVAVHVEPDELLRVRTGRVAADR